MGTLHRFVHRQNLDRFRERLATETDPDRRAMLEQLLAAEIERPQDDPKPVDVKPA